jgi:hypothetical protein
MSTWMILRSDMPRPYQAWNGTRTLILQMTQSHHGGSSVSGHSEARKGAPGTAHLYELPSRDRRRVPDHGDQLA